MHFTCRIEFIIAMLTDQGTGQNSLCPKNESKNRNAVIFLRPEVKGLAIAVKSISGSLFLTGFLGLSQPAYAYLDPGTGSIILQSIIGGIAAATAFGAMYWRNFKNFLSNFLAKVSGKQSPGSDDEQK